MTHVHSMFVIFITSKHDLIETISITFKVLLSRLVNYFFYLLDNFKSAKLWFIYFMGDLNSKNIIQILLLVFIYHFVCYDYNKIIVSLYLMISNLSEKHMKEKYSGIQAIPFRKLPDLFFFVIYKDCLIFFILLEIIVLKEEVKKRNNNMSFAISLVIYHSRN